MMELELSLKQKQILSAKMIQSAEILQMNTQELESFIKEQALENPLLDTEDYGDGEGRDSDTGFRRKLEWLDQSDEQNRIYYKQEYDDDEDARDEWNFSTDAGESLAEFVLAQLLPLIHTPRQEEIIRYMAESLNDNGYLEDAADDIRRKFGLSQSELESCIALLQTADPAGVGARSLQECLLIQVERLEAGTPVLRRIICELLEALGKNQLPQIATRLGISMETLLGCCDTIRSLNPKPGSGFSSRENLRYIHPDVTVVKFRGFFEVMLNDNSYPKVMVNRYYSGILKQDASKETKDYIRDKMKQAEWVIDCIEQRSRTLHQVAKTIVELQQEYFEKGRGHLKPMRLVDVAEKVGVHESTVSRAVRDKYLQCTWGVFPMNYFFSKAVYGQEDGQVETPEKMKQMIRSLIDEEDKKSPLSDQKIADKMLEAGMKISRRTVAKYRAAMDIKDTTGRKQYG